MSRMPSDRPRPRPSDGSGRGRGTKPSGGASPRSGANRKPDDRGEPGPRTWGALARRGSQRLSEDVRNAGTSAPHQGPPAPKDPQDVWVRDEVRAEAEGAVRRGNRPPGARPPGQGRGRGRGTKAAPVDTTSVSKRPRQNPSRPDADDHRAEAELARAVGPAVAARAANRLRDATRAFEREQYSESRRILRPLAADAPGASAVRELLGLTYYRLGQWTQAVRELEAFRDLTGSTEQHPVLADCYRALKRWPAVEDLWEELREASPSSDLVAEGRIVMAGALADRRRLPEAIALLEKSPRGQKRPQVHHLRVAYALADLKERSGDVPGARELFGWVAAHEPDFVDAAQRAAALR